MALKDLVFAALVACFFCSVGGYLYGQHVANEAHEAQQAKAVAAAEQTLRREYEHQLASANQSVALLRQQKAALTQTTTELERRIAHVSRPDCAISRGFVRLYNDAIGANVPPDHPATGADRTASRTSAAETQNPDTILSDVNQQDVLRHVVDYGGRCQAIEAQLNGLINYIESINESRTKVGAGQ